MPKYGILTGNGQNGQNRTLCIELVVKREPFGYDPSKPMYHGWDVIFWPPRLVILCHCFNQLLQIILKH